MIKEYFKLMAVAREHQRDSEDMFNQVSFLRDEIVTAYLPSSTDDIVVKEEDRYYLIDHNRGIRLVNLVESQGIPILEVKDI